MSGPATGYEPAMSTRTSPRPCRRFRAVPLRRGVPARPRLRTRRGLPAPRALPVGAALAGLALAGAACGSGNSSAASRHGNVEFSSAAGQGTSPGGPVGSGSAADVGTSATPAHGRDACAGAAVRTTVGPVGSTAEGPTVQLVFTNGSTGTCTLTGYPAVQLLGTGDSPVGLPIRHTTGRSTSTVRLAPGASATATVQVAEPSVYRCSGASVTGVQVTPPGSTGQAVLPLPSSARILACTTGGTRYKTPSALLPGTVTAVRAGGGSSAP